MKMALASDIHTEFGNQKKLELTEQVDVLVLAGDIGNAKNSITYAASFVGPATDVVLVAGNHEYYGLELYNAEQYLRDQAAKHEHVHFLERDTVELNGFYFHGTTAWTDFSYGPENPALHMLDAKDGINDYKYIKVRENGELRDFTPSDGLIRNIAAKEFIFDAVAKYGQDESIVVTHHAPCFLSIPDKYRDYHNNHSYVNSWGDLCANMGPLMWFHGHIHDPADYLLGDTRVMSNPIGYPGQTPGSNFIIVDV